MGDQDERDRRGGDLPTWDGGRRAEFDTSYLPKLETVLMATFEKDDDHDHWSAAQDRDPGSAVNPHPVGAGNLASVRKEKKL